MTRRVPWEYETGVGDTRVVAYEEPRRGGMLYLRWYAKNEKGDKNWKRQSLGRVADIDSRGKITGDCEAFAIGAAQRKSLEIGGSSPATGGTDPRKAVTIGQAEALICDPATGKYPHRKPFRDELERSLRFAAALWGADTPWTAIEESHWTLLYRRRIDGLVAKGFKATRATEITMSRLITTVRWMRRKKLIPREAALWPDEWKKDVTEYWKGVTGSDRDPQPDQPRYTLEEAKRIIAHANFDPRLNLLVRLSIGLRPGQVARARRSDLELSAVDWTVAVDAKADTTDYGTFTVYGAGKKSGVIVDLTRGQRLAVDHALNAGGYLEHIERKYRTAEVKDYALFPSGYVVGRVGMLRGQETKLALSDVADFSRPVSGSWIRKSWRTAEGLADIVHIHGRATYGFRRLGVDVADELGLSPAGLQNVGGWADSKIPSTIYRERTNKAGRREARVVRQAFLGELDE